MLIIEFSAEGDFQKYIIHKRDEPIDRRIEEYDIGIRDMPSFYEEYLENKNAYSQKDQAMYDERISWWAESEEYVFDYGGRDF